MKLKCLQCGHEFEGSIAKDDLGWHSSCPECGGSFDVDVPDGRFIIAFADDSNPEDDYRNFTDSFPGPKVRAYHAFHTAEEFIAFWEKLSEHPEGMWYWCVDLEGKPDASGYCCFCSGACDPADLSESFAEYPPLAEAAKKSSLYEDDESVGVIIGRPINGISLNGNEYVEDDAGQLMVFPSEDAARDFLKAHGVTDDDIEAEGIVFEEATDVHS